MHKIFVSYHHARDQAYADALRMHYGTENMAFLDRSLMEKVDSEDTDYIMTAIRSEGLKDSTVTIVLIGQETRCRRYVDWEIYSSLRGVQGRPRNGLLGILLPGSTTSHLPPRFRDNYREGRDRRQIGYAKLIRWEDVRPPQGSLEAWCWGSETIEKRRQKLQRWIQAAYLKREDSQARVDLTTTPRFKNNRKC